MAMAKEFDTNSSAIFFALVSAASVMAAVVGVLALALTGLIVVLVGIIISLVLIIRHTGAAGV